MYCLSSTAGVNTTTAPKIDVDSPGAILPRITGNGDTAGEEVGVRILHLYLFIFLIFLLFFIPLFCLSLIYLFFLHFTAFVSVILLFPLLAFLCACLVSCLFLPILFICLSVSLFTSLRFFVCFFWSVCKFLFVYSRFCMVLPTLLLSNCK